MDSEFIKMLDQFDYDDPLLLHDDNCDNENDHDDDQLSSVNADESLKKKRKLLKKAPDAPKRFKSAYICYVMEKVDEVKQANPDDLKITDTMKKLATMWKNLSPADREVYEMKAKDDKSRYYQEMKYYTGPMHVPNKRKKKPHGAPKRAMSAFLSFSQQMRPVVRDQYPTLKNTDISTMLAKKWHELSEEEKKPFLDRELIEREKYHKDMATWKESSLSHTKVENDYIPPYAPKSDGFHPNYSAMVTTNSVDSVVKAKPPSDPIRPIWSSLHYPGSKDDDIFLMFDTDASITYFGDSKNNASVGGASTSSSKNHEASNYPLSSAFDNMKSYKPTTAQQNLGRRNYNDTTCNPILNEANGMYNDTIEKFPIGSSERGMKKLSSISQQGECWPFDMSESKNENSYQGQGNRENAADDMDGLSALQLPGKTDYTSAVAAPLFNLKETLIAVNNASKANEKTSTNITAGTGSHVSDSNTNKQGVDYSVKFGQQFDLYYKTLATYNDNRNKSNEKAE